MTTVTRVVAIQTGHPEESGVAWLWGTPLQIRNVPCFVGAGVAKKRDTWAQGPRVPRLVLDRFDRRHELID